MSCESFKINWRFMCFELNDTEKCRGIILYKYLVFGTGTVLTGKVWCLHSYAQGSQTLRTIMARSVAVVFTTQKVGLACCSLAEMLSVVGVAGVALLVAILVSHSCLLSLCQVYAIKC